MCVSGFEKNTLELQTFNVNTNITLRPVIPHLGTFKYTYIQYTFLTRPSCKLKKLLHIIKTKWRI
jgi:hypothetical protein